MPSSTSVLFVFTTLICALAITQGYRYPSHRIWDYVDYLYYSLGVLGVITLFVSISWDRDIASLRRTIADYKDELQSVQQRGATRATNRDEILTNILFDDVLPRATIRSTCKGYVWSLTGLRHQERPISYNDRPQFFKNLDEGEWNKIAAMLQDAVAKASSISSVCIERRAFLSSLAELNISLPPKPEERRTLDGRRICDLGLALRNDLRYPVVQSLGYECAYYPDYAGSLYVWISKEISANETLLRKKLEFPYGGARLGRLVATFRDWAWPFLLTFILALKLGKTVAGNRAKHGKETV